MVGGLQREWVGGHFGQNMVGAEKLVTDATYSRNGLETEFPAALWMFDWKQKLLRN